MSKQGVRSHESLPGSKTARQTTTRLGLLAVICLLGVAVWVIDWQMEVSARLIDFLLAAGGHALLSLALERQFHTLPTPTKWQYRLAVLLSFSLFLLQQITQILVSDTPFSTVGIFWIAGGAFLGGVIATALNEPLWENNAPPLAQVQARVIERHRELIGEAENEPRLKRAFDIGIALIGFILSAPLWVMIVIILWFEDPGPLLFIKNSVGKGGRNFHQYKFRTMVHDAEALTGPVLADVEDERVLKIGTVLRKTALDELPQLINIILGEMSFVGPRPQRTVLVAGYLEAMPEYAERHRVLPGLSGLAQVAGDYYLTPRQKLRFDRLYIQHRSLGFDLRLLFLAFLITFWYRWQPKWDGRLPRRLLHNIALDRGHSGDFKD